MADNIVGQAKVKLGLEAEQFKKGIKESGKELNAFAGIAKKAFAGLAVGFSAKAIVSGINQSVEAFRQQEIAVKSLNQALMNSGTYTYEYSQQIQNLASEIQSFSNYGDEAVIKATGLGQAMAGNVKFTNEAIKSVVDFAAAMDMDLDSAFRLVGKSIGSDTNALARYGIQLDKNMTKEQKMAVITEKLGSSFGGTAREMANSSIQMKNALSDLSEAVGHLFNPAVESGQKWVIRWAQSVTEFIDQIRIAKSEINNLNLVELQTRLRQVWVELDKLNASQDYMFRNFQGERWIEKYNEAMQTQIQIYKQLNILTKKEGDKAKASSTKLGLSNIGKETNRATDDYKKFVDNFKEATNEYQATLKARDYVQKTLGISSTAEDYTGAINAYKEYFKQIIAISQSGASNKASLLKMNEEKLQQDLQMIVLSKTEETEKKQWELIKGYQQEMMNIEIDARAKEEAGGFLGSFGAGYQERLNILKWYYQEYEKLSDIHFTDEQAKLDAYNQLTLIKERKMKDLETEIWEQRGHEIVSIFENTFSQMLTNYGDFSDNMKQLALNLIQYLLKEELAYALKSIEYEKMRALAIQAIRGIGSFFGGLFGGGGMAMAGAMAHSGHYFVPTAKYHSGGMAADQTEHFALIKNNERVLSPAETTAYNNNEQQGGTNYIVYAPVVKAMDSKDVANWFNENKNQVINIVSQGIKNNTQGLRTQVQGV